MAGESTINRLAGTVFLAFDGTTYPVVAELTYNMGRVSRESLVGSSGVDGYSEKPMAPYIAGSIRDGAGLDVAALNAATDITVVMELANGKIVTGRNMWMVGDGNEAKTDDAAIAFRAEGPQGAITEN